jgi:hypothetical protein
MARTGPGSTTTNKGVTSQSIPPSSQWNPPPRAPSNLTPGKTNRILLSHSVCLLGERDGEVQSVFSITSSLVRSSCYCQILCLAFVGGGGAGGGGAPAPRTRRGEGTERERGLKLKGLVGVNKNNC